MIENYKWLIDQVTIICGSATYSETWDHGNSALIYFKPSHDSNIVTLTVYRCRREDNEQEEYNLNDDPDKEKKVNEFINSCKNLIKENEKLKTKEEK